MKRLNLMSISALLLLSFALVLPASAHIRQGTTVLQGNASLSSSSGALYNNATVTNFVLAPAVRYFIADHWALGGQMYLNYIKQGPAHSTNFELGPSGAYYFGNLDAKTIPYVGTSLLFRTLSSQAGGQNTSTSDNGTALSFFGGLSLFLTEHLAVTPEVAVNLESLGGHAGTTVLFGAGLAGFLYRTTAAPGGHTRVR
ncbi:MAG TPA: hypothetical protein VGL38_06725 [bacterium]|jgi:hypothetical protein